MGVSVEDLNTLKVAEIKEHLKKLDLPTTGFKKELVDRLKEAMESKGLTELADDEKKEEPVVQEEAKVEEPVVQEEAKVEEPVVQEEVKVEEPVVQETEAKEPEVQIPEIPKITLSLDEIKDKIIEHIKLSIARSEKLTKDLHRIEKFGIAENNPIAIELGLIEVEKKPIKTQKKNGGKAKKNKNSRYHPFKK
ncbi:hypothetical protein DAHU10_004460 [Hanseniaspora uvarum]|nr:hypothetical protein DAHU10_004460 [Hanseniaspora uvarum]